MSSNSEARALIRNELKSGRSRVEARAAAEARFGAGDYDRYLFAYAERGTLARHAALVRALAAALAVGGLTKTIALLMSLPADPALAWLAVLAVVVALGIPAMLVPFVLSGNAGGYTGTMVFAFLGLSRGGSAFVDALREGGALAAFALVDFGYVVGVATLATFLYYRLFGRARAGARA